MHLRSAKTVMLTDIHFQEEHACFICQCPASEGVETRDLGTLNHFFHRLSRLQWSSVIRLLEPVKLYCFL